MAWLEAHQELRDHPKTKRAARMLGIGQPQMIGHLLCLWWWCLDYADDGDLTGFDNADISDAAGWEGEPDDFVHALIHCGPRGHAGFLDNGGDGLHVNDWAEYGGKYVTKREQARARQRAFRERNAPATQHNADATSNNANVTRYASVTDALVTPLDKIREDKRRGGDDTHAHARTREADAPGQPGQPEQPANANVSRETFPAPAPEPAPSPFPESDPAWGAAIAKLEQAGIGSMTGGALLELATLWPDMQNGHGGWLDDAIRVAQASKARSPVYALRVLSGALANNQRPGQTPQRAVSNGHARNAPLGRDLDALLGITTTTRGVMA